MLIAFTGLLGCHASSNNKVASSYEESENSRPAVEDLAEETPPVIATKADTSFPESEMVSYFSSGNSAVGLRLFRRQQYPQAKAALEKALAESSHEDEKYRLRILLAVVERDDGKFSQAAALFAAAAEQDDEIADYLHYEAAQAYAKAGDSKATAHAEAVKRDGPWGGDVEFLLAGAARANKQHQKAVGYYQSFIEKEESGALVAEARYHLGAELAELGNADASMATWRKLVLSAPVSSWAALVKDAKVTAKLTGPEFLERGMGFFVAMRNLPSERDFSAALRRSDSSAEERCQALFHRAKSVYKERKYGRSAPLFEPAIAACKKSGNTNYEVKSSYQAGLAYSRSGDHVKAAEHYAYVEKFPDHSYADDARLRQAEEFTSLREFKKVSELLSTIPAKYPSGDMRGEALWRLARRAYQLGNYERAARWLQKQIEAVPVEEKWWAEGQADYWLGRSLAHLGQKEEAASAYSDCIRKYPLTYYSMQAFNRLRETWPEQYKELLSEVRSSTSAVSASLQSREVYGETEFRTGLKLARLGLTAPAKRQFAALGFVVPSGRKAVRDAERIDWLVATTRLLDLAGDYVGSHWIGRWHTIDYRRSWPNGANKARWRLAYP
ncbi:MAG: tetratricopeptide repeat protein, partial [Kofleriaceae bacterium]|nr:tetratricopeptide repeat protein [Kofleriaceae bacterium]